MGTPSSWSTHVLDELAAQVEYGLTAAAKDSGAGPKFLRITDIQGGSVDWRAVPVCDCGSNEIDRYRLRQGDIVFARTGATTGKSYLIGDCPRDAVFASYLIRVRAGNRVLPQYLARFFHTPDYWEQVTQSSSGSAQPGVNATKLKNLRVPLPPLPEQERIVAILDEAFAAIAKATANAEKNLANARELFESELNRVFSQRGDEWVEKAIEEICVIGDGNHSSKYPKKSEMIESGVPFIRGVNLVEGQISTNDLRYISEEKHRALQKGHLRTGDVLFTNRGEIGKVAIVDERFDGANLNSQIAWLRCRNDILSEYLFFFLQSGKMKRHFSETQSGAALQQFTIRMLRAVIVSHPPQAQQRRIVGSLRELKGQVKALEDVCQNKIDALTELKQSILHKAFTGELTADRSAADRKLSEAGV